MPETNFDIEGVYKAFGDADYERVLSRFADNFEWIAADSSPLADNSPYHGVDAVRQGVFARIAAAFDFLRVDADEIFEADGRIVVLGYYAGRFLGKADEFRAQVAHIWTVKDDKLTRFQQYVDTLQIARSSSGE